MSSLFESMCKIHAELAEKHRAEVASTAKILFDKKMKGELTEAFIEDFIDEDFARIDRGNDPRFDAPDYGIPAFRAKLITSNEDYIN